MGLHDHYDYVTQIGEGYFSEVQKYESKTTGEHVAIKLLHKRHLSNKEYRSRFVQEVKLIRSLSPHPHIIDIVDDGHGDARPWYAMVLADRNLDDMMSHHNNTLPLHERLEIMDQILSALRHAHDRSIIHRDICPANVLFVREQDQLRVKMADFGLGKDAAALTHFTGSSSDRYGHLHYVAPEQYGRLKDASNRSDLFSLGKLLNYVLTGRVPSVYHECDFGNLIRASTSADPNNRPRDINDFISKYEITKKLVSEDVKLTVRTVADLSDDPDIDWNVFHRVATEGKYDGHVWQGYIDPVITILMQPRNLREYYRAVGEEIEQFLDTFLSRLDRCQSSTGWPFSDASRFGDFLHRMYSTVKSSTAQYKCFEAMWGIAYRHDQWSVQSDVKDVLSRLPTNLVSDCATFIANGRCSVDFNHFRSLDLPKPIRNALLIATGAAEDS